MSGLDDSQRALKARLLERRGELAAIPADRLRVAHLSYDKDLNEQ